MTNSASPQTAAHQASLSFTISASLVKLMFTELMMSFNHLILCRPLLLLPSIFPSIRVFSKESALCIRWPKYWSFSFSISPSSEYSGLILLKCSQQFTEASNSQRQRNQSINITNHCVYVSLLFDFFSQGTFHHLT